MLRTVFKRLVIIVFSVLSVLSCSNNAKTKNPVYRMEEVARSETLWTGIAVSKGGRMFVNYPRWSPDITYSVAEVISSTEIKVYPSKDWNDWTPEKSGSDDFVCVQSVTVDADDYLWILDPGFSIYHGSVIEGGAKLVKVDLKTDQPIQIVRFDSTIVLKESYLNDVRVDTKRNYAYLTDSGLGAIIAVDLTTEQSRRLLADHPSTKAEDVVLTIEGEQWVGPDGKSPAIHSDGIALNKKGKYLYYQALTGHSLYRIRTKWLWNEGLSESQLGDKVEFLGKTGAADGIVFGFDGNLYLTSIEHNAIRRYIPNGSVEIVMKDSALKWPDSIAITEDGVIFTTTSQLHLGPRRTEPYRIFKIIGE